MKLIQRILILSIICLAVGILLIGCIWRFPTLRTSAAFCYDCIIKTYVEFSKDTTLALSCAEASADASGGDSIEPVYTGIEN